MRTRLITVVALGATALLPATATAADYPPAQSPGKVKTPRKGKGKVFTVCQRKGCRYTTIQKAVDKARGGDTIRVKAGTYRQGAKVVGPRYDGLKIVGDVKRPRRVQLDARKVSGARAQNGVLVNNADGVSVRGLFARGFRANGFFFVNVDGYTVAHLVAGDNGVYGIYAFNSKGGTMSDSEAYHSNDAGFYIGQTPRQAKPKRTIVSRVRSYENVVGFSGTNMRYTTVTRSQLFNNSVGLVPASEKGEKFAPPEFNVISDNDVFWNNFNPYRGAPFRIPRKGPIGLASYPIGIGVILLGGQDTTVERNRIYGNWLSGYAGIEQVTLKGEKSPALREAAVLRNNTVRNNVFGLGGRDLNGRDMYYDGSGTGNCFSGNATTTINLPADNSTFSPCPGPARNPFNQSVQGEAFGWALEGKKSDPASFEKHWIRHPHVLKKGLEPVVKYGR